MDKVPFEVVEEQESELALLQDPDRIFPTVKDPKREQDEEQIPQLTQPGPSPKITRIFVSKAHKSNPTAKLQKAFKKNPRRTVLNKRVRSSEYVYDSDTEGEGEARLVGTQIPADDFGNVKIPMARPTPLILRAHAPSKKSLQPQTTIQTPLITEHPAMKKKLTLMRKAASKPDRPPRTPFIVTTRKLDGPVVSSTQLKLMSNRAVPVQRALSANTDNFGVPHVAKYVAINGKLTLNPKVGKPKEIPWPVKEREPQIGSIFASKPKPKPMKRKRASATPAKIMPFEVFNFVSLISLQTNRQLKCFDCRMGFLMVRSYEAHIQIRQINGECPPVNEDEPLSRHLPIKWKKRINANIGDAVAMDGLGEPRVHKRGMGRQKLKCDFSFRGTEYAKQCMKKHLEFRLKNGRCYGEKSVRDFKVERPGEKPSVRCPKCRKKMFSPKTLYRHEQSALKNGGECPTFGHGGARTGRNKVDKFKCPVCSATAIDREMFVEHAQKEHKPEAVIEYVEFDTTYDFERWRRAREVHYGMRMVTHHSDHIINRPTLRWRRISCNRSGTCVPVGKGYRRHKSYKMGADCLCYMSIKMFKDTGIVQVEYCDTHLGHDHDMQANLDLSALEPIGGRRIPAFVNTQNYDYEGHGVDANKTIVDEGRSPDADRADDNDSRRSHDDISGRSHDDSEQQGQSPSIAADVTADSTMDTEESNEAIVIDDDPLPAPSPPPWSAQSINYTVVSVEGVPGKTNVAKRPLKTTISSGTSATTAVSAIASSSTAGPSTSAVPPLTETQSALVSIAEPGPLVLDQDDTLQAAPTVPAQPTVEKKKQKGRSRWRPERVPADPAVIAEFNSAIDEVIAAAKWFEHMRTIVDVDSASVDDVKKCAASIKLASHKLQIKHDHDTHLSYACPLPKAVLPADVMETPGEWKSMHTRNVVFHNLPKLPPKTTTRAVRNFANLTHEQKRLKRLGQPYYHLSKPAPNPNAAPQYTKSGIRRGHRADGQPKKKRTHFPKGRERAVMPDVELNKQLMVYANAVPTTEAGPSTSTSRENGGGTQQVENSYSPLKMPTYYQQYVQYPIEEI